MRTTMYVLGLALAFSCTSFAKPMKPNQLKCVQELSTYKNKHGKSEFSQSKSESICKKDSSEKFLACVAGTKRPLDGLSEAVKFCQKHPDNAQQMCAQNLSSYKAKGKREISANQVAKLCQKKQASKFVDCVGFTQRSFGTASLAVKFCEKNPNSQKQACVNELGAMKDKKAKNLAKGKKLGEICMKNSSVAFLDCVARSRDTKACGISSSSPKVSRAVASDSSEDAIVLKPKHAKKLPKKVGSR